MLHNFGAGFGGRASVQNTCAGQAAHRIGVRQPPLRAFAAGLVKLEHAVSLRPAEIQSNASPSNDGPQTVVHLRTGLALVETQVQPATQKIARLRHPTPNAVLDLTGHRVGRTRVVSFGSFKKLGHIAPGGKAHAQGQWVGGSEHHLVKPLRVKPGFQTNLRGVGCAGERVGRIALGPRPVRRRNHALIDHLTALGFTTA